MKHGPDRGGPTVGELMSSEPITIDARAPLADAARLLDEFEISGLPVVDDAGMLVGVLSDTDLVRARVTEHLWKDWPGLSVRHLMSDAVLTARRETSASEAASLMEEAHVHRLIVVGEDERSPIGVISTSDIVRGMLEEAADG